MPKRSVDAASKSPRTQIRAPVAERTLKAKRAVKPVQFPSVITQAQMDSVLARVRAMTKEEKIQSLKDAGILTKSGQLAKPYRD